MLATGPAESIACGERAVALAREVGDLAITSHALTNIGTSQWQLDDPAGPATLEEALRIALDAGDIEDACRAYVNIVWNLLDRYRLDEAERYLTAGVRARRGVPSSWRFLSYMHVEQARLEFSPRVVGRGRPVAELQPGRPAADAVHGADAARPGAVRRGQPGGGQPARARPGNSRSRLNELQRTGPAAAARAEAAWLHGDQAAVRDIALPVYQEAVRLDDRVHQAELGYWLAKAGQLGSSRMRDHPYAVQAAGRWREAAAALGGRGMPVRARRGAGGEPGPGTPADRAGRARRARRQAAGRPGPRRLRALGVTRIPRGPLDETRVNPAGLTARQVDVLRLLGQGYTNAADRQPAGGLRAHGGQSCRCRAGQARRAPPPRRPRPAPPSSVCSTPGIGSSRRRLRWWLRIGPGCPLAYLWVRPKAAWPAA